MEKLMGSIAVMNWRNRTKIKLIEYKGGKCEKCGYCKPIPSAYDFHHNDPEKKDFGISGKSWSIERLQQEVNKCSLLCKNCHAEIHWHLNQQTRQKRLVINKKVLKEKKCICGKTFKPKKNIQKFCNINCYRHESRKCKRPNDATLLKTVKKIGYAATGRKFGVSDNTIRKWLKL